jgi:SSU ribosomal protein S17P
MEAKREKRITTKVGTVVAKNSAKTVKVLVERLERHPLYKKTVKRRKIFWSMMNMTSVKLVMLSGLWKPGPSAS